MTKSSANELQLLGTHLETKPQALQHSIKSSTYLSRFARAATDEKSQSVTTLQSGSMINLSWPYHLESRNLETPILIAKNSNMGGGPEEQLSENWNKISPLDPLITPPMPPLSPPEDTAPSVFSFTKSTMEGSTELA
ncbi:hypothetical protein V6N13_034310 [Hibiscus sabdariffa]|uniref:Uncharacterized protein n=1 Tax=Hibiscus sabdariffa TaxID=183260 RepID=A0ABR2F7Y5_9ROSI